MPRNLNLGRARGSLSAEWTQLSSVLGHPGVERAKYNGHPETILSHLSGTPHLEHAIQINELHKCQLTVPLKKHLVQLIIRWHTLSGDATEAWKAEIYMTLLKCSGLDVWYTGQVSFSRHSESIKIAKIISLWDLILSIPSADCSWRPGLDLKVHDPACPSVAAGSLFTLF